MTGHRKQALVQVARGLRDVIRGHEPLTSVQARQLALAQERLHLDRGRARLDAGDPAGARAEADAIAGARATGKAAVALREAASHTAPIRGRDGRRRLLPEDIAAAAELLRARGVERPVVLLYHQPSPDNPFGDLLYRQALASGLAPVALYDLEDLDRLGELVPEGVAVALHLHWVNRVTLGAANAAEAEARAVAFASRLDRLVAGGVPIVWTAHNVLPHDTPFPAADILVRKAIVERASLIHLLARSTVELAAPYYDIPLEKTVHAPLPSFRGAYPDVVDRGTARFRLGLPGNAFVVALVGGLRPHKGMGRLLDALDLAAERESRITLLVAGAPSRSESSDAFLARAAVHPRVALHARMIPADDMQLYLRAADAAVLPYVVTLNSAVLMMALAFDLPVVAPPVGGIAEVIDPEVAVTFTPDDAASLADALIAVRDLPRERAVAAARRISASHDADAVSGRLMTAIRAAVASGSVA